LKPSTFFIVSIILLIAAICCVCFLGVLFGSVFIYQHADQIVNSIPTDAFAPTPTVVINRPPVDSAATDTVDILKNTAVPESDLDDLSCRLLGKCNVAATLTAPVTPPHINDVRTFWVSNEDTNENRQVSATLRGITDHVYFWVEDGVQYDPVQLKTLTDTFESKIYPTTRAFFGSEWTPGVDSDSHIYILYATGLGGAIAGYYASVDEYNPLLHPYSNAHEMFFFNADNSPLGDPFTFGVLAHEFQHMIQWNVDRNESSWLNEGFSELSSFLNGYDTGGFDRIYTINTDLQLNNWPDDTKPTSGHYGAGFLFTDYFLNRFGEQATRDLVSNPLNGLESVDSTLADIHATDPQTSSPITADDFILDWAIANELQDTSVADGRYAYQNYPQAPHANNSESINTCPQTLSPRPVHQYGVDFIHIHCSGNFNLHFEGSTQVKLLPVDPHSGSHAFWSNKGDEADMRLTRQFDLTHINSPVTFSFWTWFDLEKDYDYVYLEASTDGEHWHMFSTPSTSGGNPTGNNLGKGYTGQSNSWIHETVDLSNYAGSKVFIRFEYVTDGAVNGEGFLVDDLSLPALGYTSDLESDDGSWQTDGFARIQNALPQTFRLALILKGTTPQVEKIQLNADQTADIPLNFSSDVSDAYLVVIGTNRLTDQLAAYQYEIR